MRGKFTTRNQDFIAGPQVETRSHCCETRGCAGGNGDLFGCAPYQLCERGSNAVRQVKVNAVWYGVREFLPFERLSRGVKRNAGQRALARGIEVRSVLDFKPFLPPIRHEVP